MITDRCYCMFWTSPFTNSSSNKLFCQIFSNPCILFTIPLLAVCIFQIFLIFSVYCQRSQLFVCLRKLNVVLHWKSWPANPSARPSVSVSARSCISLPVCCRSIYQSAYVFAGPPDSLLLYCVPLSVCLCVCRFIGQSACYVSTYKSFSLP